MVEADFSGYATKNGLKCSDGRTIMPGAFKHNDQMRVPLVWQHQHNEPTNILGHAILENRPDGVYAYGFFNDTPAATNSKTLVSHGDISALSIYANNLSQQGKNVMHGDIREVSLVLSGANPGAFIDNVNIAHGDGIETLVDEAVIYTGLELEHSSLDYEDDEAAGSDESDDESDDDELDVNEVMHTLTDDQAALVHQMLTEALTSPEEDSDLDLNGLMHSLDDDQTEVIRYMLGEALAHAATNSQGDTVATAPAVNEKTVQDVFNSLSEEQKNVVYYMIGEALADDSAGDEVNDGGDAAHSGLDTDFLIGEISGQVIKHMEDSGMSRNVFDQTNTGGDTQKPTLSHSQIKTIVDDAQKLGSLKDAFLAHADEYGIQNIDLLFPEARLVNDTPEFIQRRQEWVAGVINGARKSPFSRIKSTAADITAEEARAKGYVKGTLKKDEIIKMLRRITTPTTIYKKQKLDRDDVVDIVDLDVVAWLKAEMRVMLDEELARAVLLGDGRDSDDEDKIDQEHIRPIADDADMYATQITIGSDLNPNDLITAILRSRIYYKGTGTPTMYTTNAVLTDMLLLTDKLGRRLYPTVVELAAALRVTDVIAVEAMDVRPEILAILVNMTDYTLGADNGGNISMFDDFDIDYNQYKYLIETRVSGALTKPKSALVIKQTVGTSVTPSTPSYNAVTHVISLPAIDGVVYSIDGNDRNGNVTIVETTEVEARPVGGYFFPLNTNTNWTYVYSD